MSLPLYMDEHVRSYVSSALRVRGLDVLTTQRDHHSGSPDQALLDRSIELGRIMFSQDEDMLSEATLRLREGRLFSGLIFSPQHVMPAGELINQLELVAQVYTREEMSSQIVFLPLR